MYKQVEVIEVWIWGKRVGAAALDAKIGYYAFEYDKEWLNQGIEIAPLFIPTSQGREPFIFPELPALTYKRLPAFLADSLPDDFGNALIEAWMAEHGVSRTEITSLDRLAYMGKRSMGALEFKPARSQNPRYIAAIEISRLVESARLAVAGDFTSEHHSKALLHEIIRVGTSAGGARAKAVVAWNRKTKEVRAGQFLAPPGFEHWILKFDGLGEDKELGISTQYGRIEYAYHLMAHAAGMQLSESRLLEENGRAHFMTKRFDRENNNKSHIQTLCAMAHLDYKQRGTHSYSQFFTTMQALKLKPAAFSEAFRRMAFNVLALNRDDHTKNISFLLSEGKEWELAPAYDITYAYNPKGEWTYQHLMSVQGKFSGITKRDLLLHADMFRVAGAKTILNQVTDAVRDWDRYAREAKLAESERMRIALQIKNELKEFLT